MARKEWQDPLGRVVNGYWSVGSVVVPVPSMTVKGLHVGLLHI